MGKDSGVAIQVDDKKILIWGWVAVVASVAVGIAVIQLSAALAVATFILSGCGGLSMIILSIGKAMTWKRLADVQVCEAQRRRLETAAQVRRLTSGED